MLKMDDLQQIKYLNEENYKDEKFIKHYNNIVNNLLDFKDNVLLDQHIHDFLFNFNDFWKKENIDWNNVLNHKINEITFIVNAHSELVVWNIKYKDIPKEEKEEWNELIDDCFDEFFQNSDTIDYELYLDFWSGIKLDFSKNLRQQLLEELSTDYYNFKMNLE